MSKSCLLPLLISLLLLAACAELPVTLESAPQDQLPDFAATFGDRPAILSTDAVHQLTPAQQAAFLQYFNDPRRAANPAQERLFNYLQLITRDFVYESVTYTATEVLTYNSGNCLSLAILTTALARVANVKIHYQLIDSHPVFEQTGSVISKEVHVRSILYPLSGDESAVGSDVRLYYVDYLPTRRGRLISNVADSEYQAMYYRNIAAEALADGNNTKAYWYSREALQYSPRSADALNMLAVIHRRTGDYARAEAIFLHGIALTEDRLTLLKNYRVLLTLQGRTDEAAEVLRQLEAMDDPSPFHWVNVARDSYASDDFRAAIRYYDKALALAPYLHEAWLGKALGYYQLNQPRSAREALQMAIAQVSRASTRSLYEAKLSALVAN
jgi:Tfp pilus assembly protein PilF